MALASQSSLLHGLIRVFDMPVSLWGLRQCQGVGGTIMDWGECEALMREWACLAATETQIDRGQKSWWEYYSGINEALSFMMKSHHHHVVSNQQEINCLFNSLFWLITKKTTSVHITGLLWFHVMSSCCTVTWTTCGNNSLSPEMTIFCCLLCGLMKNITHFALSAFQIRSWWNFINKKSVF